MPEQCTWNLLNCYFASQAIIAEACIYGEQNNSLMKHDK